MEIDRQIPGNWQGFGFTEIRDLVYPPRDIEAQPVPKKVEDYYKQIVRRVVESDKGAIEVIFHETDPEHGLGAPSDQQLDVISQNLKETSLKLKHAVETQITPASPESEAKILVYLPKQK